MNADDFVGGHSILALERFMDETRHMIIFDVLSWKSPVGEKGERLRLFLSDVGYLDDGWTLEVNRLCTTGEKNACSILYAASARAAKAMGYRKIITYTLDSESGSSLRAAGWNCAGLAGGKCWTGSRKPASALYPAQMKLRYEKLL